MKIGRTIYGCETVESTQDIARRLALEGVPAGTVVTAQAQTKGRGRQGHSWFTPPGSSVCMTIIGRATPMAEAWQLSLVVAVAVAEMVREGTGVPARVRFPNDIYVEGAKLGGILIETAPHPRAGYVTPLVGIGVNINVREEEFPEELRERATSLSRVTGQEWSRPGLTGAIIGRLEDHWDRWTRGPLGDSILPAWRALADAEARRIFVLDGRPVTCRVLDIGADGTVTLEAEDGARRSVHAAHVLFE